VSASAALVQRRRLDRLRHLGVGLSALDDAMTRALVQRFGEAFVDPAHHAAFAAALARTRGLDYDRFLRPDCVRPPPLGGSLPWLGAGSPDARCYRLEREAWLPAVELQVRSLDETWATSWPGVFVSFHAARAVVVTLDYERIHCELRQRAAYR